MYKIRSITMYGENFYFFKGTRRVHANVVYQEYISDRNHLHMNSTQVSERNFC